MQRVPVLLKERLRDLRAKRGWSRSDLSFATVRLGYAGVGIPTIEKLETEPGRVPSADILEALAAALEVGPAEFYEYPLAVARRSGRATGTVTPDAAGGRPDPPGELGRRATDSQPKPQRQPRAPSRPARGDRS